MTKIPNEQFEKINRDLNELCNTVRFSGSNGNIEQFHGALVKVLHSNGVSEQTWWDSVREQSEAWKKGEGKRLAEFVKEYPQFRASGLPHA